MREAADDLSLLELLRCGALLRHLDERREILRAIRTRLDVRAAREADSARREHAVLVAVLRRHEAVRREQHGATERLELLFLLPPGVAVVADEVVVLLERRIVVRRQHFAVRIDVDARALRLLEEHLEVVQVVAGDEDGGGLAHAELHLRDLGVAEVLRVRLVECRHALDAPFARLERERRQIFCGERIIEQLRERLLQERIDVLALLAEHVRMVEVRCEALDAVRDELAQAADVLVRRREHADIAGLCLRVERLRRILPERCRREAALILQLCKEVRLRRERLRDARRDHIEVEVRVRDGDEEVARDEVVDLTRDRAALRAQARRDRREALRRVDEQVLHAGDFRLLAADTDARAALAECRLLALETKHRILHRNLSFSL